MAELLDQAPQTEATPAFAETSAPVGAPKKRKKKGTVRRVIAWVLVLALLGGGFFAGRKLLAEKTGEGEAQVLNDYVTRGAITSTVQGSGVALPKNSASVSLLTAGQVLDVYVSEGEFVTEGTPLYSIDSTAVEKEIDTQNERIGEQRKYIEDLTKSLAQYTVSAEDLVVRADYAGRIIDVARLNPGEEIGKDVVVATLVDDTKLLLPLYFSYAYENEISLGQNATISIPSMMAQLPGKVHEIHKVERISAEGSKLFEVVLELDNPGTLSGEGTMEASATLTSGGEPIYPYASGKLEYFRTKQLTAKAAGTVASSKLYNFTPVKAGETLVTLTARDNSTEIASVQSQIKAQRDRLDAMYKELDEINKKLDLLNATAPIDGTVLAVGVHPGEEAAAGTIAVSIADTSTMIINASVDEMNVSYIKQGMIVDIDQWGTQTFGTVESVSLTGQYENGVSRFPVVISVDNSDGMLMSGSYVQYNFTASQSDDCLLVQVQSVKYVETENGTQKVLFVHTDERPENAVDLLVEMPDIPEGYWPVPVETGISDNYNVEILAEIEEGTEVYMSKVRTEMW